MKEIKFSYNWNNKLNCFVFTTIRLENHSKYKIDETYTIFLKDKEIKTATIIDIKTIYLHQINTYIALLDTGYPVDETKAIFKMMYPKIDFTKQKLSLILLKEVITLF
jgi:hypothetical protein